MQAKMVFGAIALGMGLTVGAVAPANAAIIGPKASELQFTKNFDVIDTMNSTAYNNMPTVITPADESRWDEYVTGSNSGVYRDPWEGTVGAGTFKYHSIRGGGSAEYTFGGLISQMLITWGSPDDYNTLEFYDGATMLASITGDEVDDPPTPQREFVNLTFSFSDGTLFDKVKLISQPSNAFEHVVSTVVPLPAAAWFLLTAIGGLFGARFLTKDGTAETA